MRRFIATVIFYCHSNLLLLQAHSRVCWRGIEIFIDHTAAGAKIKAAKAESMVMKQCNNVGSAFYLLVVLLINKFGKPHK